MIIMHEWDIMCVVCVCVCVCVWRLLHASVYVGVWGVGVGVCMCNVYWESWGACTLNVSNA